MEVKIDKIDFGFEIPPLRDGLQAIFCKSMEARRFGPKDPASETTRMLIEIQQKLKIAGAHYRCSALVSGPTGGFVGIIVVAERNSQPSISDHTPIKLDSGINFIRIEADDARKFGPKKIDAGLTERLDGILRMLSKGSKLVEINSIPSNHEGATIGIVATINNISIL